ncbi:MAG: DUF4932 domain-containing protein, partial [Bacteroidetes bacterium]|nr:DUF4932 domain-containing protein [Bacteroidota bacterium]
MTYKKKSCVYLFLLFLLYMPNTFFGQTEKIIDIKINKNVELFNLMVQIDNGKTIENLKDSVEIDGKKIAWKDFYAFSLINYHRYKNFDNSDAINFYRALSKKGISDVFIIGFLLQVDEVPKAKINSFTDKEIINGFSKTGDEATSLNTASQFLRLLNSFYKEIKFKKYLKANNGYYTRIISQVNENLPQSNLISFLEGYYQKKFAHYYFVPSLNQFPGTGFGQLQKSTNSIFDVFGALKVQNFKSNPVVLGYDSPEKILGLAVHEFGHSFVDPAIDKIPESIIKNTEYLYEPIKDSMSSKGYISWNICLHEHFVKAGEIIIARKMGQNDRAEKIMEENVREGFRYLPQITSRLTYYSGHKSEYKSYDEFVETVVKELRPVTSAVTPPKLPSYDCNLSKVLSLIKKKTIILSPDENKNIQPLINEYCGYFGENCIKKTSSQMLDSD